MNQLEKDYISKYMAELLANLNLFFAEHPEGVITKDEFMEIQLIQWKGLFGDRKRPHVLQTFPTDFETKMK